MGPGEQAGQTIPDASAPSTATRERRNRQLNFESKVDNFATLVKFLENEPSYQPQEPEFPIEGLKAKLAELHGQNIAVNDAIAALQQARAARNEIILNNTKGVTSTGKMVKRYFRVSLEQPMNSLNRSTESNL